LFVVFSAEMEK